MERDLLEYILDVSRRMAETQDLTLLLNYVMDEAIRLVGAERGYVVLAQPDGSLDFPVKRGQNGQALEDAEDQVSRSILRQVVETGQPLVLRDAAQDPRFEKAESVVIFRLRSIMCVPLISRGDTIGAIYVENRSIRGRFSQDDAIPLVLFANQAAVAIENARLFQTLQKAHDELEMRVEERTLELSEANALLKQEITERRQAEEALRESEKKYRDLVENISEVIYAADKDGVITYISPAVESFIGYSPSEIMGRSFAEFIYQEDLPRVRESFQRILSGYVKASEYRYLTRSGELRWVRASSRPAFAGDRVIGLQGVLTDITERKRAEEERERLILELQEVLATIKSLSGMIPICAWCGRKIRDEEGRWVQLEVYITERSEAQFSHGMCPDCAKKVDTEVINRYMISGYEDNPPPS